MQTIGRPLRLSLKSTDSACEPVRALPPASEMTASIFSASQCRPGHDHKLTDPARYKHWTGVGNKRIKANFQKAYESFPDTRFVARTPLIPGFNDDEDHIRSVLAFIRTHPNVIDYQLLPYHRYGESKYGFLGKIYELKDFASPTPERMAYLRSIIDAAFGRGSAAVPQG